MTYFRSCLMVSLLWFRLQLRQSWKEKKLQRGLHIVYPCTKFQVSIFILCKVMWISPKTIKIAFTQKLFHKTWSHLMSRNSHLMSRNSQYKDENTLFLWWEVLTAQLSWRYHHWRILACTFYTKASSQCIDQ